MNWNKGFLALYEIKKVDPVSFMDMGSFDFTAGSITRSDDTLVESAELTMKQASGECWVRIYLKAKQGEDGEKVAYHGDHKRCGESRGGRTAGTRVGDEEAEEGRR